MDMINSLVWFREDLRVTDNAALYSACQASQLIFALYVIDIEAWQQHDIAACRIEFMLHNLSHLKKSLAAFGIPLLVYQISQSRQIHTLLSQLVTALKINTLYFNDQYEVDEQRRDQKVIMEMQKFGLAVDHFIDQVMFGPGTILTKKNAPYSIFTPYKKAFLARWQEQGSIKPLPKPRYIQQIDLANYTLPENNEISYCQEIPKEISGFVNHIDIKQWPAGETAAYTTLKEFTREKIQDYNIKRNFPAQLGTSILSPYLSNGVLSSRQCFDAAIKANNGKHVGGQPGIDCWISELIWREFYKQVLWAFPQVSMYQPFKAKTAHIQWQNNKDNFKAWCAGQTGYPIIDAAMRQLNQTGWMHNRLRMIVAMFLTKDCFIDWRWGEKYFMQHLIDGDLAANNGGWQWAASTGVDAVPYFRMFNPILQSQKFDPQGLFIKRYCPELKAIDAKLLHNPALLPDGLDYPKPIIKHGVLKALVLAAFRGVK